MLDTLRHVETPEGVELALRVAGPVSRAQAWMLDLLIKLALLWVGAFVTTPFGRTGAGLYFVLSFAVLWLYSVAFEVWRDGATPGKRVLGLRVVHDNGTPVGWPASMIRSLIGFVDMLPVGYAVGLVSTLLDPQFKRLGDLAAGTVVVHTEKRRRAPWKSRVRPIAPPVPLHPDEQRAVVEFAERTAFLTDERADELARIVSIISDGGDRRSKQLLAQASWIAGHR
jgi:uncharacterized RDD family membrane protein YckC